MATRKTSLADILNRASGGRQVTHAGEGFLAAALTLQQATDAFRRQLIRHGKG